MPNSRSLRHTQRAWYVYDWANSAFQTTVITVFLGPYLTGLAEAAADAQGFVHPLGLPVRAVALYPYLVSLSALLQVVTMPLVGALADRTGRRRLLLGVLAYIGAVATMLLYFVRGDQYLVGGLLFLVASVAFTCSLVVYNAWLPDIAGTEERDAVSSRGWACGYLGGGLLLSANLVLLQQSTSGRSGIEVVDAVRISILSAGGWWALFTLVPLARLGDAAPRTDEGATGFRQLAQTLRRLRRAPATLTFLAAYLLFNDGVQTVISQSAIYADQELGMPPDVSVSAVLIVQLVAVGGALGLAILASLVSFRTDSLLESGESTASALTGGFHAAFLLGAAFVIAAIAVAVGLLRPTMAQHHQEPAGEPALEGAQH